MSDKPKKAGGGSRYKRSWRNYLIDKDYQLRNTIISVVIAASVCTALGTLVIWQTRLANAEFKKQGEDSTDLFQRQRNHSTAFQDKDPDMRQLASIAMADLKKDDARIVARRAKEDKRLADRRALEDAERVVQRKKQDSEATAKRSRREIILLIGIIAFGIVFLVVIFVFNIVITHRTAGPMFKMGRYMDEVRECKFTEVWNLRKGDQLVELYGKFQAMHNAVKAREQEDVEILAATMAACEEAELTGEAIDELKARLEQKRVSLGADTD